MSRTCHTQCDACGRSMLRASRYWRGQAFCSTCYAREFIKRRCVDCGGGARVHISLSEGQCRPCWVKTRRCGRCERLVPRASLIFNGITVCPSCRRHFPPFPRKCRPSGHRICSVCRKPRKVCSYDQWLRPKCSRCSEYDRTAEAAAQDRSYWASSLVKRTEWARGNFEPAWAEAWLDPFIEFALSKHGAKSVALRLPHYLAGLRRLAACVDWDAEPAKLDLSRIFSPDEMRIWSTMTWYLERVGVAIPSPELKEQLSERRRVREMLVNLPRNGAYRRHLLGFADHLASEPNRRGQMASVRSQRLALRPAIDWLSMDGAVIQQPSLIQYLKARKGQRAGISRFVGWLNSQGYVLRLPPKAKTLAAKAPPDVNLGIAALLRSVTDNRSLARSQASMSLLLAALGGISLRDATRTPREAFVRYSGGFYVQLGAERATVDGRFASVIDAFLRNRDQKYGDQSDWLFPGRPPTSPVSTSAVWHHLQSCGIHPASLLMVGRRALRISAIAKHP